MTDSDEWTREIKASIAGLVQKALTKEREEFARLIHSAMVRHSRDSEALAELLSSVTARHALIEPFGTRES